MEGIEFYLVKRFILSHHSGYRFSSFLTHAQSSGFITKTFNIGSKLSSNKNTDEQCAFKLEKIALEWKLGIFNLV